MTDSSDNDIAMVMCFDHEEVGSTSVNGAESPILAKAVHCISTALFQHCFSNMVDDKSSLLLLSFEDYYSAVIKKSFCISID
jgi:aspartyl aminopeptidase